MELFHDVEINHVEINHVKNKDVKNNHVKNNDVENRVGTLIIGCGPAGLGVCSGAARLGAWEAWCDAGVVLVDASPRPRWGRLDHYGVRSDSFGRSFLAPFENVMGGVSLPGWVTEAGASDAARQIAEFRDEPVPLAWAAELTRALGESLASELRHRGTPVQWGTSAISARRTSRGTWQVELRTTEGHLRTVEAVSVVQAMGSEQATDAVAATRVAGRLPGELGRGAVLGSDVVLGTHGQAAIRDALIGAPRRPRVAVVGGSHSAWSTATQLLATGVDWEEGAISVVSLRPPVATFASPEAALRAGFWKFGRHDICPVTGRVFPLAGMRADSRHLICRVMGWADDGVAPVPEPRVRWLPLAHPTARTVLDDADLIVMATGYQRHTLPLYDVVGRPIGTRYEQGGGDAAARALVDASSRVVDSTGEPLPGMFALGLGAGFPLAGTHGEPSFRGEANGTSLWQTDIGELIAGQCLSAAQAWRAASAREVPVPRAQRAVRATSARRPVAGPA